MVSCDLYKLEAVGIAQHVTISVNVCSPIYLSKVKASHDMDIWLTTWRMGIADTVKLVLVMDLFMMFVCRAVVASKIMHVTFQGEFRPNPLMMYFQDPLKEGGSIRISLLTEPLLHPYNSLS